MRDKDTTFTWEGYPKTGELRDYSDGYGELLLRGGELLNMKQLEYGKDNKVKAQQYHEGKTVEYNDGTVYRKTEGYFSFRSMDKKIFVNFEKRPIPTVHIRKEMVWNSYQDDAFVGTFGDEISYLGIRDAYLEYYLKVKDTLTAHDYEGALVRYRKGGNTNTYTARVVQAHAGADHEAVVVDLATNKKEVISVSNIQGVLLSQFTGGETATIKRGNTSYYGELFLAFSNDELSVLVHGMRHGEGELELLDDKHTITVDREDEGLVLH